MNLTSEQLDLDSLNPMFEKSHPTKVVEWAIAQFDGDVAMTSSGGSGMFKSNELERLYRDVRAGGFHPANTTLTHEIVGKTTLGIGLDEQPRWG